MVVVLVAAVLADPAVCAVTFHLAIAVRARHVFKKPPFSSSARSQSRNASSLGSAVADFFFATVITSFSLWRDLKSRSLVKKNIALFYKRTKLYVVELGNLAKHFY